MTTARDEVVLVRLVAGETLADPRTVRREMREPGSVRGAIGERIRVALGRYGTGPERVDAALSRSLQRIGGASDE